MEVILNKINELQQLTKVLKTKSCNLTEYSKIYERRLTDLKERNGKLLEREIDSISKFKDLFDNANDKILNTNDIIAK